MYNRRYRILAGTALALILAAPIVGMAKNDSQIAAAVPTAAPPAEQATPETAPAPAAPTDEAPAVSGGAAAAAASPVEPAVAARSAGVARSRRPRGCAEHPRPPGRQGGQIVRRQEGARRGRGVLPEAQFRAALARPGSRECARRIGRRPPEECRYRRPRARRLPVAELRRPCTRGAGRGRAQAHARRAHLCAPRAGRPFSLYPREPQHRAAAGGARARGRPEQHRECRGCGQGARPLQPAARALSQAQGDAGGAARQAGGRERRSLEADRDHRRQHGALALVCARPRQAATCSSTSRTSRSR